MSNFDLVLRLFLQLTVILLACRIVGILGRYVGQTQVVSEMVTGVILGPSLLGYLFPSVQTWLFPAQLTVAVGSATSVIPHPSMSILYAFSQIGLVLYMFLIGLDFDAGLLRGRLRSAGTVSLAGIATPFALGAAVAYWLLNESDFFSPGILNIGLQAGVIRPTLFTIMVLMAVVTTLMASPLFRFVYGRANEARQQFGAASAMLATE